MEYVVTTLRKAKNGAEKYIGEKARNNAQELNSTPMMFRSTHTTIQPFANQLHALYKERCKKGRGVATFSPINLEYNDSMTIVTINIIGETPFLQIEKTNGN